MVKCQRQRTAKIRLSLVGLRSETALKVAYGVEHYCCDPSPLASRRVVSDIREWLERENIEPSHFQTIVNATSLGFEISFTNERDAVRFRQRFPSFELVGA
jgi:hypothetical protein